MATGKSGSFTIAGNEGFTAKVTWTESYDIAANTSVVSLNLAINSSTYRGTYYLAGSLKVNGSSVVNMDYYSPATHKVEVSAGSTYYQVQAQSGTAPPWASAAITHNSDGSKSVSIAVNIEGWREDTHMFNISGTTTITLTTIARTSTLTASNGTLGTAQTLSISRQSSSFTHSIRYDCGSATGAIVTKTASTSVSFTPSLNLAQQNTTGTSVTITFTLYTFNGDTEIGRTTKTISCAIPASVKPSCTLSVTDTSGHVSTYGGYLQGISGAEVIVTPTTAQGSPISSYSVTADGKTYTNSNIEIPHFSQSGTLTISATVKDKRSRSGSASKTVTVIPYSAPNISHLSVMRCNEDGTENISGLYAKVTYSHSVTTLSNKNAKAVKLKYKKTSETEYTTVTLTSAYTSENASYIFAAADDSSYNVSIEVSDTFNVSTKSTSVSTASVLMHVRADGTGMAFGKISERSNALEFGKEMYDRFGSLVGAGLSAYGGGGDAGIDPDTTLEELCLTSHTNAPKGLGTFYFIHTAFYSTKSATAARAQIAFPYNKTGAAYHRYYANSAWSAWTRYLTVDEVYPVNSVIIWYSHDSPASIYGGTWHRMQSRFLWGTTTDGTIGATGGEQTHTLTQSEMPTHTHLPGSSGSFLATRGNASSEINGVAIGDAFAQSGVSGGVRRVAATSATGSGEAHNNMPPYVNVAFWRRTA